MLTTRMIAEADALAEEDLRQRVNTQSYPDMTNYLGPTGVRSEYQRLLAAVIEATKASHRAEQAAATATEIAADRSLNTDPERQAAFMGRLRAQDRAVDALIAFEAEHKIGE